MKDHAEYNAVARLLKKQQDGTLGRPTKEDDALGNMHLGDTHTYSNGITPLLLAAVTGGAAAVGAAWLMNRDDPKPQPQVPAVEIPQVTIPGYVIKPGAPEGWQPK